MARIETCASASRLGTAHCSNIQAFDNHMFLSRILHNVSRSIQMHMFLVLHPFAFALFVVEQISVKVLVCLGRQANNLPNFNSLPRAHQWREFAKHIQLLSITGKPAAWDRLIRDLDVVFAQEETHL